MKFAPPGRVGVWTVTVFCQFAITGVWAPLHSEPICNATREGDPGKRFRFLFVAHRFQDYPGPDSPRHKT